MRKLVICCLGCILFSNMAAADVFSNAERIYQIEVIIFSHITEKNLQSEKWPWTSTKYIPKPSIVNLKLVNNGDDLNFSVLPRNTFFLASEQRLLDQNNKYHVLLHLAWRQKIARPKEAQPVHIFGGNIYNVSGDIIGKAQYGQQPYQSKKIWQVNGTITPSLIRFIDLKFNLLFSQPLSSLPKIENNNNVQGSFAYFRLQQKRRMKSRELNYIGHPLYGVLVKIVPIT